MYRANCTLLDGLGINVGDPLTDWCVRAWLVRRVMHRVSGHNAAAPAIPATHTRTHRICVSSLDAACLVRSGLVLYGLVVAVHGALRRPETKWYWDLTVRLPPKVLWSPAFGATTVRRLVSVATCTSCEIAMCVCCLLYTSPSPRDRG